LNTDEKGFMKGKSHQCKDICRRQGRGITGNLAQDGNQELNAVIETICGYEMVLPPLVIYKGAKRYMGWYQHLEGSDPVDYYSFCVPLFI